MFKTRVYFEAASIQSDKEYHNTRNILLSGYRYTYIPTSVLLKIIKESIEKYNEKKPAGNKIKFTFIASLDKEHAQFSLTGKRKDIDAFATELFTADDLLNHWTVSKISKYSLVH